MDQTIAVSTIAHTIQLVMAPVFMVAGIAGLLNLLALRLNRVVDRARALAAGFTAPEHPDHGRQVWELRILDRRIRIVNRAILLCTASAIAICLVVAGLFIAALAVLNFGRIIAVAFILAMLLLVSGCARSCWKSGWRCGRSVCRSNYLNGKKRAVGCLGNEEGQK